MSKVNFSWWKKACAALLLSATTAIALPAQTFTTLVNFDGTNGFNPTPAPLVQGTDGNLYGTTLFGGANQAGTVFKLTPSGTLTTLYSFCAQPGCADGNYAYAGLLLGTDGSFYGATILGGAIVSGTFGYGTIFRITPDGTLTTLHSFDYTDGAYPYAGLIQAADGAFYGTTNRGGTSDTCGSNGCGTVFRITSGGTLTTLHNFDYTEGIEPGALIQASDGNFYGATAMGAGVGGYGTVFKITSAGALTTLHRFAGYPTDGTNPSALIQATNGSFYGTTSQGGASDCQCGTVFKITSTGTLTTLVSFDGPDGSMPLAALVQAGDGDFYGTTSKGGANGYGTVFKITSEATLTTLHSFDGTDGSNPPGGLVEASNGTFYGTTFVGGTDSDGTVFSLPGPTVLVLPTAGAVRQRVLILGIPGTTLAGATSVTFNGTPATFTVLTPSLIRTSVPAGATTGFVFVVTPTGTLRSKVEFRVP